MSSISGLEPLSIDIIVLKWEAKGKSIGVVNIVDEATQLDEAVITKVVDNIEEKVAKVDEVVVTQVVAIVEKEVA